MGLKPVLQGEGARRAATMQTTTWSSRGASVVLRKYIAGLQSKRSSTWSRAFDNHGVITEVTLGRTVAWNQ